MTDPFSLHPIEHRWIRANVLAAIASVAASLVIYALRQALGAADADAGTGTILIQRIAAALLSGAAGVVDGVLTGAVLQRIVPQLPVNWWIALRSTIAIVSGIVSELSAGGAADDPAAPMPIIARIVVGAVFGGVLGLAAGSLEAVVIRKAATGVNAWIEWSMIGYAVALGLFGAAANYVASVTGGPDELVNQLFGFAVSVVIAVMLIPALRQLQPRHPT